MNGIDVMFQRNLVSGNARAKVPKSDAQWEEWLHQIVLCRYPPYLHDDLMQEGRIALWQARQRYTDEGRALLTTVVSRFVVGRMLHYLRDKAKTIRVSSAAHEKGERIVCISNCRSDCRSGPLHGEYSFALDYYEQLPPWEAQSPSLESTCLLRIQVQNALGSMTPRQRLVVGMVADGYTFADIGRFVGSARKSASIGFHGAQKKMKPLLEREGIH